MALVGGQQESCMLEQLLPEIMVKVIECLDFVSRVKLAGMNSHLQRRVYQDSRQAWVEIDFCSVDYTLRTRLTDYQLSRLLTRVNARDVTARLTLRCCKQIRGSGLAPLWDSRVLERLDMSATEAYFDPSPCLDVLRSMIAHKLYDVNIHPDTSAHAMDFFRNLRLMRLKQAQEQNALCNCCQEPVMEKSRQLVPNIRGVPDTHCGICSKQFCRRSSCPTDLRECTGCELSACSDCRNVLQCHDCGFSYCGSISIGCTGGSVYDCDDCGKQSCLECGNVRSCECCGKHQCRECSTLQYLCEDRCSLMCEACREDEKCSNCNSLVCVSCDEAFQQCSKCSERFCTKTACCDHVERCMACSLSFCKDCKTLVHCDGCKENFCQEHNRFVDCAECEMHHCRACRYVKRCRFCGTACFEECLCEDQLSAKRTKSS